MDASSGAHVPVHGCPGTITSGNYQDPWRFNYKNTWYFEEPKLLHFRVKSKEIARAPFGTLSITRQPVQKRQCNCPMRFFEGALAPPAMDFLVHLAWIREWWCISRQGGPPDRLCKDELICRETGDMHKSVRSS